MKTSALRGWFTLACVAFGLLGCSRAAALYESHYYFLCTPPVTQESNDLQILAGVDRMHGQWGMNPSGVWEATGFARMVTYAFDKGTVERQRLNGDRMLAYALRALESAEPASPKERADVLTSKGEVLLLAGKTEEGMAALRAAMDIELSVRALDSLLDVLDKQGDAKKEIAVLCKKARSRATDNGDKFGVLESCFRHSHAKTVEEGLAWAGEDDIELYEEMSKDVRENRARLENVEKERAQVCSEPPPAGGWVLSLENNCPKTVLLFVGNFPGAMGDYTSLRPGEIQRYVGRAGKKVWITNDELRRVASFSPSGTQRRRIAASCSEFTP